MVHNLARNATLAGISRGWVTNACVDTVLIGDSCRVERNSEAKVPAISDAQIADQRKRLSIAGIDSDGGVVCLPRDGPRRSVGSSFAAEHGVLAQAG